MFAYCLRGESDYNIFAALSTTGGFASPLPKSLKNGYGVIALPSIPTGEKEHGYRYSGPIYTFHDDYAKELIKASNWNPTGVVVQYESDNNDQAISIIDNNKGSNNNDNGNGEYTILPPRDSGVVGNRLFVSSVALFSYLIVGLLVVV